jgi:hypothetical protein
MFLSEDRASLVCAASSVYAPSPLLPPSLPPSLPFLSFFLPSLPSRPVPSLPLPSLPLSLSFLLSLYFPHVFHATLPPHLIPFLTGVRG